MLNSNELLAKSSLTPDGQVIRVCDHNEAVAALAAQYGEECGMRNEAYAAALYHDSGKVAPAFQAKVRGQVSAGVDHAFGSAMLLCLASAEKDNELGYAPLVDAVNAHHEGLISPRALRNAMRANDENTSNEFAPHIRKKDRKSVFATGADIESGLETFWKEMPDAKPESLPAISVRDEILKNRVGWMLWTRMILSCLVDADYTESALEEGSDIGPRGNVIDAEACFKRLERMRKRIKSQASEQSDVNTNVLEVREELFQNCVQAGDSDDALCTATAPTGAGKTIALMGFALRRCITNAKRAGKRRVIVVLPYHILSDQTEAVYRKIVPDLIVDHSNSRLTDAQRQLAARWDAPCIITTSVKFFETLFSSNPRDLRKLHNIANSVVIFDEAQTLRTSLAACTAECMNILSKLFGTTVVLSTATQPEFAALKGVMWEPKEIVKDVPRMFERMKRCEAVWDVSTGDWDVGFIEKRTDLSDIAKQMAEQERACVIVNLKRHANYLYNALSEQIGQEAQDSIFIITANLCPKHRFRIINQIRQRMSAGLPVRVVATQCIDAGVDLDFDVIYRAFAPLDSIIQAAGRGNRNGRLRSGETGRVIVFIPKDDEHRGIYYPKSEYYESGILALRHMLAETEGKVSITSPKDIQTFYETYYAAQNRKPKQSKLEKAIEVMDYEEVDKLYRLIDDDSTRIIVPYVDAETGNVDSAYKEIIDSVENNGCLSSIRQLKEAADISVASYGNQSLISKYCFSVRICISKPTKLGQQIESGVYIVKPEFADVYRSDIGLDFGE